MADTRASDPRGVYLFPPFERFWHWSQAALIIFLMATGAEIHGFWTWLGFERALNLHVMSAFALLVLWVFAIFWHIVTGQWRHYVPTTRGLWKVISFYATGIFRGAPHPFKPSTRRKHNPMQAMAYLGFKLLMAPGIWISGLILWLYGKFPALYPEALPILWVNAVHVAAAFLIAAFLIAHLYLITTGETVFAQLRAMITGWDRHGTTEED
ncbi:cytochrome b/b6 domain-containing protein [Tropicimonas sediminicola]|uniref:Thiosulfate reductase cytochrome b subunit n=1 Tax=Tropicimonas sediminicola TaxID=1031541 RepID=A0A239LQ84_9RHOB|nr:cytochrome b/b6 domain-containing protein [Tropicimonas sediminicola]SNT31804.1 Thiosulfate reductase cytochrome b subunit [Tropicimonas sediminicola]